MILNYLKLKRICVHLFHSLILRMFPVWNNNIYMNVSRLFAKITRYISRKFCVSFVKIYCLSHKNYSFISKPFLCEWTFVVSCLCWKLRYEHMYLFNIKKTISYLRSKIDRLSNFFSNKCKLIYECKLQIIL